MDLAALSASRARFFKTMRKIELGKRKDARKPKAKIAARPYMAPALRKNLNVVKTCFANCIKGF